MKIVSSVVIDIIVLIISYVVLKKYNDGKFKLEFLGMKKDKAVTKHILIGLITGSMMFIIYKLILFIMHIEKYKGIGFKFFSTSEVLFSVITAFAAAVFESICEETFCRGILLNYFYKFKGQTFALIISSAAFTLIHVPEYQNFIEVCRILIFGVALGYCYILAKSLYLPIALHFVWNFSNLLTSVDGLGLFVFSINKRLGTAYCDHIIMAAQAIIEIAVAIMLIYTDMKIKVRNEKDNNLSG